MRNISELLLVYLEIRDFFASLRMTDTSDL